jgi:hypothetical protein
VPSRSTVTTEQQVRWRNTWSGRCLRYKREHSIKHLTDLVAYPSRSKEQDYLKKDPF